MLRTADQPAGGVGGAEGVVRTGGPGGWWHEVRATLSVLVRTPAHIEAADAAWRHWRDEGGALAAANYYCARCGCDAGPGAVTERGCAVCVNQRLPWVRLVRLGAYDQPLDDWVRLMKFHRAWHWSRRLGRELAAVIAQAGPTTDAPDAQRTNVLCPVPMSWRRRWQRGYNQAQLLARAIGAALHWPVLDVLYRTRHTRPQTSVPPSRRALNVRGSFAARAVDLQGCTVWLIDDVKTSGATLRACARLLHRAGAERVYAGVVAVAQPR